MRRVFVPNHVWNGRKDYVMDRRWNLRRSLSFVVALQLAGSSVMAAPAHPVPLVSADGELELVKKRRSSGGDEGEKSWLDYLLMALKFDDADVVDQVKDGRIVEHLLGGLFSAVAGHIWAPMISYQDIDERPQAALILGIVGTVIVWAGTPFLLFSWVYGLGVVLYAAYFLLIAVPFAFWFIPRAIQFAYSDAYESGGGSRKSRKKKRRRSEDEDDEE